MLKSLELLTLTLFRHFSTFLLTLITSSAIVIAVITKSLNMEEAMKNVLEAIVEFAQQRGYTVDAVFQVDIWNEFVLWINR